MRKIAQLSYATALAGVLAMPTGTASAGTTVAATPATAAAPATTVAAPSTAIGDDYPYRNGSWDRPDPWNFYQRECTSFVAWRLRQLGVPFHNHYKGVHWGNANNWDNAARSVGVRVDRAPTVGSVAQWNRGRFGHVAYVARVSGGSVLVEEYNRLGTHRYDQRTISAHDVENVIHIAR